MGTPLFPVRWPIRHWPELTEAGSFPMTVPDCNRAYVHPTLAVHLHEYAGTMRLAGRTVRLQPGDITLTPPRVESRYGLDRSGTHLCIHFAPASAPGGPTMALPFHFRPGALAAAAREHFWRVIDYARRAGEARVSPARGAAAAALQELLIWVHLQSRSVRGRRRLGRAEGALARLRGIIDASLARQMSVPDLARQAGLSADYLSRLFRRHQDMSIPRYLLLRRMELARHLLRSTLLPVGEVGRQVGIPDPQYFNKQFRRLVGESPSHYRWQAARRPAKGARHFSA